MKKTKQIPTKEDKLLEIAEREMVFEIRIPVCWAVYNNEINIDEDSMNEEFETELIKLTKEAKKLAKKIK